MDGGCSVCVCVCIYMFESERVGWRSLDLTRPTFRLGNFMSSYFGIITVTVLCG